jgi:methyl coenzyme M reductase subunit D
MDTQHQIFKAAVEVYDQSDCDKLRDICERYELPIWKEVELGFKYIDDNDDVDQYLKYYTNADDKDRIGFYIDTLDEENDEHLNIMPMEEFEELADNYNPQFKSVDDILSKMKELNNLLNNK